MGWTLVEGEHSGGASSSTRRLQGHQDRALGARWLRDGRILSWGGDWTLRLWDPDTGALLRTYDDPARTRSGSGGIRGAHQLTDGRVLSWGYDGIVSLWELDQVQPTARIEASTHAIAGVLLVDDVRFLSWSGDGAIRLWRLDDLTARRELPLRPPYEDSLQLVPPFLLDGARGLVGWKYDQLHYISFTEGAAPRIVTAFPSDRGGDDDDDDDDDDREDGDIVATTRLPNGNLIAFGRAGGVREWSLPELELVREYQALPAGARGACTLADGRFAAWYAGRLAIYRPGRADVDVLLDPPHDGIIEAVALHGGGIAYRTVTHRLVIWSEVEQRTWAVPDWREPRYMAVAPNDDLVVWSPYADGLLATHEAVETLLSTDGSHINHVALHPAWPETRHVLASVARGEIFDFDVAQAPERRDGSAPSSAVEGLCRVSDDELLAWHQNGELSLHGLESGARTRSMGARERTGGALPVAGRRCITWERAGSIYVWSLDTGALLGVLAEADHGPLGATVLLDAERAVSWSWLRDRVGFLLWRIDRVESIAALGRDEHGPALGAAPLDGGELVTWSETPSLRRWDRSGNLLETIECHGDAIAGGMETPAGIVTWTDGTEVSVWAPDRRARRTSLRGTAGAIVAARVSGDDVLFGVDDGALVVWRPASGEQWKLQHSIEGRVTEIFALRGGRWIVLDDRGGIALCSRTGVNHRAGAPPRGPKAVVTDDEKWLILANHREVLALSIAEALGPAATLAVPSAILALLPISGSRVALGLGDGRVVFASP